jgi:predicted HicB family RNase H-like nuclease
MNTLKHKDYLATIELDEDAGLFHGEVINTRAVLTFQGTSIVELKTAFADTITDYEEWCRQRGKEPEKSYSGFFTVRVMPELHRKVAEQAIRSGMSLNAFVRQSLETCVGQKPEPHRGVEAMASSYPSTAMISSFLASSAGPVTVWEISNFESAAPVYSGERELNISPWNLINPPGIKGESS